jgi:hypothetical protein
MYNFTILFLGTRCCEWLASRLGRFTPEKSAPDTHWVGGGVGPGAGLGDAEGEKSLALAENQTPIPRSCSCNLLDSIQI